jgi:hypothetical protein
MSDIIDSIGTLYAIQDLFDDIQTRVIHRDPFLKGFRRYGTSTAEAVLATAIKLNWICIAESGQMVPTNPGMAAHRGGGRQNRLRFQLANIIEAFRPPWAALLPKGRKETQAGLPEPIRQCFKEALLFEPPTDELVQWWDHLAGIMREHATRRLIETGRRGERLSMGYEASRTGMAPQWKAIETNYAGYDVLSIHSQEDTRSLKIEVKASTLLFRDARLNVTQHEWQTAKTNPEEYIFHFWLLDIPDMAPGLFVIRSDEVLSHLPTNQGKGAWTNAAIPISALSHPSKQTSGPSKVT